MCGSSYQRLSLRSHWSLVVAHCPCNQEQHNHWSQTITCPKASHTPSIAYVTLVWHTPVAMLPSWGQEQAHLSFCQDCILKHQCMASKFRKERKASNSAQMFVWPPSYQAVIVQLPQGHRVFQSLQWPYIWHQHACQSTFSSSVSRFRTNNLLIETTNHHQKSVSRSSVKKMSQDYHVWLSSVLVNQSSECRNTTWVRFLCQGWESCVVYG